MLYTINECMPELSTKQAIFVKKLAKGMTKTDAAINAGYSRGSASVQANRLLKNDNIKKALEKYGLTDHFIASKLKKHVNDGMGIKPNADTSLRALDLITKLKGYQAQTKTETSLNQTNIYLNELKTMDDAALTDKLNNLLQDVSDLKNH